MLDRFHTPVKSWFEAVFASPTRPQLLGWEPIARGESTLLCAPTGSGKTLAAFLWAIDRLMFAPPPARMERCRVLYISPIKALAVDVERNLRAPLVGIAHAARRMNLDIHEPLIATRTGDTPSSERAKFARHPSDILITTPESIYLLLTSNAREALRSIETVIIDEIHALVGVKRGSHLALSIERLEHLCGRKLQRIGLSATQRPLSEVARFLGGGVKPRPVAIVDASEPKRFELRIEVPVDDMSRLDILDELPSGPAAQPPKRQSMWSAIHPKLLELVRAHRSTILFVNSRRLAERISGAINELAGETLVRAHHGSVAAAQRKEIEDRLKMGTLRGIVATSSLELGIDMGAVDLVVQIESPLSVASGMQRVGRANHNVGGVSSAVIFPKYRGDLVACAAIARAMYDGAIESVRYPRNPLDVLAQQIVAMVAMNQWEADALFEAVREAAPFNELTRAVLDSVLDMLAGRYPSDEFIDLRPRINWDRASNRLSARQGARNVAIVNGGTIPDRGLYGMFLAGAERGGRVGELDEEMVFESHVGETIILGASTWRIAEITHDRVIVEPAPGEPGRMPFWKGEALGRPAEFGRKIGAMTRELAAMPRAVAYAKLIEEHSLDESAAENLLRYLEDQNAAVRAIPSDKTILIERCRDELGDWRVCVLTPFGRPVHAPWCMAVSAKLRDQRGLEPESMWTDDGFVVRLPDGDEPFDPQMFLPSAGEMKDLVLAQLGSTSLFAAKFREAAGRALLLPKRRPGVRAALWQQRKRSADLLAVASRYAAFPIIMEAYRECLADVFDLTGAAEILREVERGAIRVASAESEKPSPFASALLFSYVANYIYDGDAPLAERRAQALSIDQSQLQEILGSTDLRELLDKAAIDEVEAQLQSLDPDYHAKHADGVHDLLLKLGDLTKKEIAARSATAAGAETVAELVRARRAVRVKISEESRYIPVEYAAAYCDALGVPLPPGLPDVFLDAGRDPAHAPVLELARRYARTHGPFTTAEIAHRFGVSEPQIEATLTLLHASGKILEGEFRPEGVHREWCDAQVLQQIRRRSLARLRREVAPAEQHTFARFLARWHGVTIPRKGTAALDALMDAIGALQGAELLASDLESAILPARVADYQPQDLDALMASGEVVWIGRERIGERDGRVALYLGSNSRLQRPPGDASNKVEDLSDRARRILDFLMAHGASFFAAIHDAAGGGFPGDTLDALWELTWAGRITNDTFAPLRNFLASKQKERTRAAGPYVPPGSPEFLRRLRSRPGHYTANQGRWSLTSSRAGGDSSANATNATEYIAALAQQLLARHGIVMRETASIENLPGGYPTIYPALRTMEESGWIRRGMFVAGLGAAQFAVPAAVDLLRSLRTTPERAEAVHLAASDPANPYGSVLAWPRTAGDGEESSESVANDGENDAPGHAEKLHSAEKPHTLEKVHSMSRGAGANVVIVNGRLAAFFRRRNPSIRIFLPEDEPERSQIAQALAKKLAEIAVKWQSRRDGLLIGEINDRPAREHAIARFLGDAGFVDTALGFQMRRVTPPVASVTSVFPDATDEDGVVDQEDEAGDNAIDAAESR